MASSNSGPDAVVSRRTGRWLGGTVLAALVLSLSWYLGKLQRDSLVEQLEAQLEQELALYVSLSLIHI